MTLISEIMQSPVIQVAAGAMISEAVGLMHEKLVGSVVVTLDEGYGIFTERDLIRVVYEQVSMTRTPIDQAMSYPAVTIVADASVIDAAILMKQKDIRRLLVLENGALAGVVTQTDIARSLQHETVTVLKQRAEELEMFNQAMVGRELRMSELKQQLAESEGVDVSTTRASD